MNDKIIKKLSSQAGESIGETLVALLISALALVMLAGAVTTGMRIVTNSKEKMDAYYKVNNAVVARENSAKGTSNVTIEITNFLPIGIPNPEVDYWKNEELSGTPVIAYTEHKD